MCKENTKAASQLQSSCDCGKILSFNDSANLFNPERCPQRQASTYPATLSRIYLLMKDTPARHLVVFDALDASVVHAVPLRFVGPLTSESGCL